MVLSFVGQMFVRGWSGDMFWFLVDFINVTMLQDLFGKLILQGFNDVLVFILEVNEYLVGFDEFMIDFDNEGDLILID